jgi:hypothetical protein
MGSDSAQKEPSGEEQKRQNLEALSVNDLRPGLIVFLLGDPHLLESGEGGQDGATNPDGVFTLRGSDDFHLHGGRGQGLDFLLHTLGDTLEHGCTTRQDDVAIQILSDIDIAFHDGVIGGLVDTSIFLANKVGFEQHFGASETLVANGDDLTIRQFIVLLQGRRLGGGLHFLIEIQGDIGQFLLDISDDFSFGGGGEGITTFSQDFHEVISQITTGQIQRQCQLGRQERPQQFLEQPQQPQALSQPQGT